MQSGEYRCLKFESVLEYSAMVEEFRQLEHKTALTWLERWRRVVRWYEEEIEAPRWHKFRTEISCQHYPPKFLYVYAEAARSHVRNSEQAVADAAVRLGSARQEHFHAISEHGHSLGDETAIECPQKPCLPTPSLPDSNSRQSSQSSSFSSSQLSIPSPSPATSHFSQPSVPPQSQTSHSTPSPQSSERMCKGRKLSNKGSSADKRHRRSNKKNTRKEAKIKNIDTEQQAISTFVSDSHNVEGDDDTLMEKPPEDASPFLDQSCGLESEDTVMTEVRDPPNPILSQSSQPSRPIPNTKSKKLHSPAQGPTPRKNRYATKSDQTPNSRVLKNTNKEPAKKAKAFTDQQATTLLDAASNKASTTIDPPLRRSERLKEKAAVSAATAVPQLNGGQLAQPSQQRQSQDIPCPGKSSESSTQKKRKREPHEVGPLPETAEPKQKKRKRAPHEVEPLPESAEPKRKKRRT